MTSNIKTIKLTSIVCSITFALAFFVCLNISYEWFEIKWLSNTFLLTIIGGVFASSAVVLFCEIQHYLMNKTTMENQLWELVLHLQANVAVVKHKLESIINTPVQPVPEGLFNNTGREAADNLVNLRKVDYVTFRSTALQTAINQFFSSGAQDILLWVQALNVLNFAVNSSKLKKLTGLITGEDTDVSKTVQTLFALSNKVTDELNELMKAIDYSGRFNYEKALSKMQESYDNLQDFDFESFLQETNTKH